MQLCCLLLNFHWFAQGAPGRKKRRARKKKAGFATYYFSLCFVRGNSTVYSCISISTLLYISTLLLYDSNLHSRSECHFWLTNFNSVQRGYTASEPASRNSRRTAPIGRVSKATALKILSPFFLVGQTTLWLTPLVNSYPNFTFRITVQVSVVTYHSRRLELSHNCRRLDLTYLLSKFVVCFFQIADV